MNEVRAGAIARAVRVTMGPPAREVAAPAWTAWIDDRTGIAFALRPGRSDAGTDIRIDVCHPIP